MTKGRTLRIPTPWWSIPLVADPKRVRYRGAHGGRGGGKSHLFAEMILERCVEEKTDVVCIREYQQSLQQSVKRLIELKIKELKVEHLFEVQKAQIKVRNGGLIIFQGMQDHNSESVKSLESFDIAWVEEAQSLSKRSLELLRPTIRKEDKKTGDISEMWFSWNPRHATDPIDELLRGDDPPPNARVVEINFPDNPWFPDVLQAEMEYDRKRDPDKYAHVWCGGYLYNSSSRVFHNWTIENFVAPEDAVHKQGADWGFSVDPSVLVRSHVIGRKLYIDYEAYEIGCDIHNLPTLFMSIPDAEKWPTIADSNRKDTISYMKSHGFPKIYGAAKGKGSIEEGVEWLKTFDIIVHPRCKHTIDELTFYSYKVDKDTGLVLPVLQDKKNHVIDSLRYSQEGHRRAQKTKVRTKPKLIPINNPCATYLRRN